MGKNDQQPMPVAAAKPITQAAVSATKQASGPAAVNTGSGRAPMPAAWGDTVHETSWVEPDPMVFGADSVERPDGVATEQPFVPETVVEESGKPVAAKSESENATDEEAPAEGEAEPEKPETDETPVAEVPEDKTPVPVESKSLLRRRALDALRIEGENRALQARLTAERQQRESELRAKAEEAETLKASLAKLRTAPLEERLKAIGIETQDELFEAGISGKVKMPDKAEAAPTATAAESERVARLEGELLQLRIDSQIRAVMQQGGSATSPEAVRQEAYKIWQADGSKPGDQTDYINRAINQILTQERTTGEASKAIRDEIANAEANPAPFVRATQGALDAVAEAALVMWKSNGSKPGDFARCAKACLESAEEMYAERDAKYEAARAARAGLKPAAPAAAKPAGPPSRPAPPIGKRVASRGAVEEDDGPLDPALRDAWIRDQNRKAGRAGW